MPQTQLLILDLDRTLFDTGAFLRDIEKVLAGHDITGTEDSPELKVPQYFAGQNSELKPAVDNARRLLPRTSYCYPDTKPFLVSLPSNIQPVLMTFTAIEPFQRWKLQFAPEVGELPTDIVQENKGAIIAVKVKSSQEGIDVSLPPADGSYSKVWMIEDNILNFEPVLKAGTPVNMIHLARPGERYANVATPAGVSRVESLPQALALLQAASR